MPETKTVKVRHRDDGLYFIDRTQIHAWSGLSTDSYNFSPLDKWLVKGLKRGESRTITLTKED